jgi:hypothetical protein
MPVEAGRLRSSGTFGWHIIDSAFYLEQERIPMPASNETIMMVLGTLMRFTPLMIVWLVGFFLAIIRWREMPRVSALTAAATAISMVTAVGNAAFYQIAARFLDMPHASWMFTVVGLLTSCAAALAWALILMAAFSGRRPRSPFDEPVSTEGKPIVKDTGNPYQSP